MLGICLQAPSCEERGYLVALAALRPYRFTSQKLHLLRRKGQATPEDGMKIPGLMPEIAQGRAAGPYRACQRQIDAGFV
jgi:hypothetical protein